MQKFSIALLLTLQSLVMALLEKELEVKSSTLPGAGKGLFTKNLILKGSRIVEYKGEVKTWDEARLDATNAYIYFIKPNYVIDARDYPKSLGRYANDAEGLTRTKNKTNNTQFVADGLRVFLVALRNIQPGEELLVGYGRKYWDTVRQNRKADKESNH